MLRNRCVSKDYLESLIGHIMHKAHEGGRGRGGPGPRRGRRGGRRGHGPPPQVKEAVENYWNQYVPTDAGCDGKVFNGAEDLQAFIQNMATQVQAYIEQNYPEGPGPGTSSFRFITLSFSVSFQIQIQFWCRNNAVYRQTSWFKKFYIPLVGKQVGLWLFIDWLLTNNPACQQTSWICFTKIQFLCQLAGLFLC